MYYDKKYNVFNIIDVSVENVETQTLKYTKKKIY
jgi:hypothetical protein